MRIFASIVLGVLLGSVVDRGLIVLGGQVIAPPPGADVTTVDGLKAAMHLFAPRHVVFPFLAHAAGTFVGALVASFLAPRRSMIPAGVVGACFLLAGIANIAMPPAPAWFHVVDLVFAYVPAALLGRRVAARSRPPARRLH